MKDRILAVWDEHPELVVIGGILAVLLAVIIPMANREAAAYEEACNDLGGHVVTTTNTGVNTKDGGVIVSSEAICIRDNQRIYP